MGQVEQNHRLLREILGGQPVIPVITIAQLSDAVPLARALVRGGLKAIEITLRTPSALDAVRQIADEVPEVLVGAGTVLNSSQYREAERAGARFIVSPGSTPELLDSASDSRTPFLPGAATPSEVMGVRERGYRLVKFFPAEQAGGTKLLKAMAAPLHDIGFCPTGGIASKNAGEYLNLSNVVCIGGSWVAPAELIADARWNEIEKLAKDAFTLKAS